MDFFTWQRQKQQNPLGNIQQEPNLMSRVPTTINIPGVTQVPGMMTERPLPGTTISAAPPVTRQSGFQDRLRNSPLYKILPDVIKDATFGKTGITYGEKAADTGFLGELGSFFAPTIARTQEQELEGDIRVLTERGIPESRAVNIAWENIVNKGNVSGLTPEEQAEIDRLNNRKQFGAAFDIVTNIPGGFALKTGRITGPLSKLKTSVIDDLIRLTPTERMGTVSDLLDNNADELDRLLPAIENVINEPSMTQAQRVRNLRELFRQADDAIMRRAAEAAKTAQGVVSVVKNNGERIYYTVDEGTLDILKQQAKQYGVTDSAGNVYNFQKTAPNLLERAGFKNGGERSFTDMLDEMDFHRPTQPRDSAGRFASYGDEMKARQVADNKINTEIAVASAKKDILEGINDVLPVKDNRVSTKKLSSMATNSLENSTDGIRPQAIKSQIDDVRAGKSKRAVEVRLSDNGGIDIVDGRHLLETYRKAGIKDIPIKDVTKSYFPNGVKKNIFTRTAEDIRFTRSLAWVSKELEKRFGHPIDIVARKILNKDPGVLGITKGDGSLMGLLKRGGSVSEWVGNHEGWHWFKRNLSDSKRAELNQLEKELRFYMQQNHPDRIKTIRENSKKKLTEQELNEELMADEFARYYHGGRTVMEKLKAWFDQVLETLGFIEKNKTEIIDRVGTAFRDVKPTLRKNKAKYTVDIGDATKRLSEDEFKNFNDLSTKLLGRLEGKTTVSKQFIQDLTNNPDVKQTEKDLFRALLADEGEKVNVKEFAERVRVELLPLKPKDQYNRMRYSHVVLDESIRGPVNGYDEIVYTSPVSTSAGNTHFRGVDNYFAHVRRENLAGADDLKGYRVGEDPEDGMWKIFNEYDEPMEAVSATSGGEMVPLEYETRQEAVDAFTKMVGGPDMSNYSIGAVPGGGYQIYDEAAGEPITGIQKLFEDPTGKRTMTDDFLWFKTKREAKEYLKSMEQTGRNVRRIIEVQSDLFQKGNLERELENFKEGDVVTLKDGSKKTLASGLMHDESGTWYRTTDDSYIFENQITGATKQQAKSLEPYKNSWWQRVIREEIKAAAQDGKTVLQFPTGETAMKVEGLGERSRFYFPQGSEVAESDLKPGLRIISGDVVNNENTFVVTEVLGDGKFKAAQAWYVDHSDPKLYTVVKDTSTDDKTLYVIHHDGTFYNASMEGPQNALPDRPYGTFSSKERAEAHIKHLTSPEQQKAALERYTETFDMSGKVDTSNPIYKFYEEQVDNYLQKKYGGKLVTDNQGVTWVEIPVTKQFAESPVEAFKRVENFDPEEYVASKVAEREAARGAKMGIMDFFREVKKKGVDFTAPIEDALAKALKETGIELKPTEDITNQIDRALRAPSLSKLFIEEKGLKDIIQKAPDIDKLDQYLIAKHAIDLDTRGITTGRDILKDQTLVDMLEKEYEPFAKQVKAYSDALLDQTVQYGLIDEELAGVLRERYPNYVPFKRVFEEVDKYQAGGGGVANLSQQTIVQRIKGSERQIESPLESLLVKTQDLFRQGERNLASKMIAGYEKLPGNPLKIEMKRTTENVKRRIALYSEAKDLKPLQNRAERALDRGVWALDRLETELNKLNKLGLKEYLRAKPDEPLEKLVSGVDIKKRVRTVVTPRKLIGDLNLPPDLEERLIYAEIERESLDLDPAADLMKYMSRRGDFKGGLKEVTGGPEATSKWARRGDDIASELGFEDTETARQAFESYYERKTEFNARYKELMQEANAYVREHGKRKVEKVIDIETYLRPAQLARREAKKYIEEMIVKKNRALEVIKDKIANREPKVAKLIDDITEMRDEYEGIREMRAGLRNEAWFLKDAESRGKSIISFFDQGVKNIAEVPPEIEAAARALNVQQLELLGKIMAAPTRLARIGITGIYPPFLLANMARDQVTAFINSKNPLRTSIANLPVFFKALTDAVGHGKMYDEWIRAGGGGTSYDLSRNQVEETLKQIRSGKSIPSRIAYTARHPGELLRAVEDIVARSEELTRLQQYRGTKEALLAKGMSEADAIAGAARASRENTVNFARRGEWGTQISAAILYLNARIQGTRTLLKNLTDRPLSTASKIAIAGAFPVAYVTIQNLSDPQRKAAYEDISEYEKENNMILIPPNPTKDEEGKWNVIKIPMSQEITGFMGMVRRPLEQMYGLDPVGFQDFANSVLGTVSPLGKSPNEIFSNLVPQAIKPSVESYMNKSLFTGNPIVPYSLEKLPSEDQYRDWTSGTMRFLGDKLGMSPLKMEAWIKGTFGSIGSQLIHFIDTTMAKTGVIPEDQIGGTGMLEAIQTRFSKAQGGEIERQGFERLREREAQEAAERKTFKEEVFLPIQKMDPAEAQKAVEALTDEEYETYKSVRSSWRSSNTSNVRDLLEIDPKEAVTFLRSLPKSEQERILNLLTDEEYAQYELGKPK